MDLYNISPLIERMHSTRPYPTEEDLKKEVLARRRYLEAVALLPKRERNLFLVHVTHSMPLCFNVEGIEEETGINPNYAALLTNRAICTVNDYLARFGFTLSISKAAADNDPEYGLDPGLDIGDEELPPEIPSAPSFNPFGFSFDPDGGNKTLAELESLENRVVKTYGRSDKELYEAVKKACIRNDVPALLTPRIAMSAISYIKTGRCQPILLVGNAGTGKTFFAKILSEVLGLGFFKISGPGATTGRGLTGDAESFKSARYGEIVNAMLSTHSTNPVILIDEIDKSGKGDKYHCLGDELLSCLDGTHVIHDNNLEKDIDTSSIPFVLTANVLERIPPWLIDRCMVIEFPDPDIERILSILEKQIEQLKTNPMYKGKLAVDRKAMRFAVQAIRAGGVVSLRQYNIVLENACLEAFREMFEGDTEKKRVIVTLRHFEAVAGDLIRKPKKKDTGYHIGFAV